jgi:hypothetical protein
VSERLGDLAARAQRSVGKYGARGAVVRAAQRSWRQLARNRNVVFVHGGRPDRVVLPSSISVTRCESLADVPESVLAELIAEEGERHPTRMCREFARGGVMWTACENGQLAGCLWSVHADRLGPWFVELQPDDLLLYAVLTLPAFRGRLLAPALSCAVIGHERREGARAFIDCKEWNHPARRYMAGAGFERLVVRRTPVPGVARRVPPSAPSMRLVPTTDEDWYRELAGFADADYRQSWAWGELSAERVGSHSEHRAVVDRRGETLALVDVRVKPLVAAVSGIAYVSGGPLVRRGPDANDLGRSQQRLRAALRVLIDDYVLRRRMALRIVPSPAEPAWVAAQKTTFAMSGFVPTGRAARQRTIVLDLATSAEALRRSFAQKWRNCLNRAEREELAVRAGREPALLDEFIPLFDELVARKRFDPGLGAGFFARVQRRLPASARFHVALATVEGRPVAGQVTSLCGDTAVYVLGASNDEGRRRKAAYLLQWDAIAAAKQAGCHWYDLGGIDPDENPDGYRFKRGMGGVDITAAGPYEIRPPGITGHLPHVAETAYLLYREHRG